MQTEVNAGLIVYFNGAYVPIEEAKVGILTHALHYGTGVFEGIRAFWNADREELYVLRMAEHYERWRRNCGILRIELPKSTGELCEITLQLFRLNGLRTDAYVRPLAFKSAERVGVSIDGQDGMAIVALPFGEYLHAEKGLHACVSTWRRVDDNAIPARGKICGAYVNSVLASDEARRSGFDEAILLNQDGHVAEGATCNLFMVRNGTLITPSVQENVLEGLTRDAVMELASREMAMPVVERPIDRSELLVCDELFFTGTAVGIAPITRLNHRSVGDGCIGKWTRTVQQIYSDAVHGRLKACEDWLTPVYHPHAMEQQDLAMIGEMRV